MPKTLNTSYDNLVEKAQSIFWQNGYKSVSPNELAKGLGVSPSTIYNKFGKERLFIDGLQAYVSSFTDPALDIFLNSTEGLVTFKKAFYPVIDALYDGFFPRNCFMVNTVVELRNEVEEVNDVYTSYFPNLRKGYVAVLERAYKQGEIKSRANIPDYVELMMGTIFAISAMSKVKTREDLKKYFDAQISFFK